MISIMTRNTIIFSPHPISSECSIHCIDFIANVAEKVGLPQGTIQTIRQPNVQALELLMSSPRINLTLATGGPGRVNAAYSSGNPAIGMGPGNVACFVHKTADVRMAASHIISSNSFDYGLPCVCESVLLADKPITAQLKEYLILDGGYFVSDEEEQKLRLYLFPDNGINPHAYGKSAIWIAQQAGFTVPEGTRSLLVDICTVGLDEPISKEKLFPVMGYIIVDGVDDAINIAQSMLDLEGKGHSAVIHSEDPFSVVKYTEALPVCRVAVNTQGVEGSSGVVTKLTRGPMIGTGFFGGSSIGDNIGPKYLIQWSRAAYPFDSTVSMDSVGNAVNNVIKE